MALKATDKPAIKHAQAFNHTTKEETMDVLKTLIVSTFVYGWIYGEKLFYFIIGKENNYGLRKMSR